VKWRVRRPLVSVILAAYNHEDTVEEAVRSVLDQSMDDLELIVVDDASTDRTAEVVAGMEDSRIRLIRNRRNGERHPRNFALSLARGSWVGFQNSDDVWETSKLASQLELFGRRPELSVVFTDVVRINGRGEALSGRGPFLDPAEQPEDATSGWLRRFLLQHNCVAIASALARRRDLARVGGMDPQLRQLADFDLWIRLAARGGCAIHPGALTKVRFFDDGSNMSAGRPEVTRRTFWEQTRVLRRFAESSALKWLPSVLPELGVNGSADVLERKMALARFASENPQPAFRLWAEWLLSELIRTEEKELQRRGLWMEATRGLRDLRASLHPPVVEP